MALISFDLLRFESHHPHTHDTLYVCVRPKTQDITSPLPPLLFTSIPTHTSFPRTPAAPAGAGHWPGPSTPPVCWSSIWPWVSSHHPSNQPANHPSIHPPTHHPPKQPHPTCSSHLHGIRPRHQRPNRPRRRAPPPARLGGRRLWWCLLLLDVRVGRLGLVRPLYGACVCMCVMPRAPQTAPPTHTVNTQPGA